MINAKFSEIRIRQQLEVLDVTCTYGAEGRYGAQLDAKLYVKGQLAQISFLESDHAPILGTEAWTDDLAERSAVQADVRDFSEFLSQRDYYLLIVVDGGWKLFCLVLETVSGALDGLRCHSRERTFPRVGTYICRRHTKDDGAAFQDLRSKLKEEDVVLI